jgi:hypothetical protein
MGKTFAERISKPAGSRSVFEVPRPGKHHGYPVFVAGFNRQLVVEGTAGLYDCLNPGGGCGFHHIREGEEGV